ncbi:MAG: DinB family protein [Bacteroidota bacterium]
MKNVITGLLLGLTIISCSNQQSEPAVKSLLIEQLENTYSKQNWFVPAKVAIEGINQDQATWKDSTDNHSIIENVLHIIFWNERNLAAFKEEPVSAFNNDNEETFIHSSNLNWAEVVQKLDSVQTGWEQAVKDASDEQILAWSSAIANMTAHTAYHSGQIIYIRKRNGWWK